MVESARIIGQALDGLPEGPFIADDRKYVLPPRSELSTSMESLIHHFKLVTEGYRVAAGRGLLRDREPARRARLLRPRRRLREAGPGPLPRPLLRQPAGASRTCAVDSYIADMICSLGMLDPILGGVDR